MQRTAAAKVPPRTAVASGAGPPCAFLRRPTFPRHPIRACHRTVDRQRPEPAQTVGTATGLINAANIPSAAVDRVIRPVLVDPGAEAGRAHGEGHVFLLNATTISSSVCKSFFRICAASSEVLPIAIRTRNPVDGNLELRARHCG